MRLSQSPSNTSWKQASVRTDLLDQVVHQGARERSIGVDTRDRVALAELRDAISMRTDAAEVPSVSEVLGLWRPRHDDAPVVRGT
jgi:hypothetical protein